MSDTGGNDISSQIGDKGKPDAQKTTTEKFGDRISGALDRIVAVFTPKTKKSTTQSVIDSSRGEKHEASDRIKGAADSLTGKK